MLVHRPPSDKGEEIIEVELQKKSGKGAGLCLTGYKSGKGAYVSDLVRISLVFLIINKFVPSICHIFLIKCVQKIVKLDESNWIEI